MQVKSVHNVRRVFLYIYFFCDIIICIKLVERKVPVDCEVSLQGVSPEDKIPFSAATWCLREMNFFFFLRMLSHCFKTGNLFNISDEYITGLKRDAKCKNTEKNKMTEPTNLNDRTSNVHHTNWESLSNNMSFIELLPNL